MKRLLFLEDEEVIGKIYKKHLEQFNCTVDWVQDVASFWDLFKPSLFDFIVIDEGLASSEDSGSDLIPHIRFQGFANRVVLLSNFSSFDLRDEALAKGADAYFVKIDTPPQVLAQKLGLV